MSVANGIPEKPKCEVLIVGAGPAGLMLALWMARLGISTRIIDKRNENDFYGQADGINGRSMEIFDSFDFMDRFMKESSAVQELCWWNDDGKGCITRTMRSAVSEFRTNDVPPAHTRYSMRTLISKRVGQFMIDDFQVSSDIRVEWETPLDSFSLNEAKLEDEAAYPVTVKLKNSVDAEPEVVHAKYLVGCDGGHSLVRRQLGFRMSGESTDTVFGVVDVIPITSFPDARRANIIRSAAGSLLYIPREKGLVRLYVNLSNMKFDSEGRVIKDDITPEAIVADAQKILSPYTMTFKHLVWWTVYQIGQRVSEGMAYKQRIFLAGDAVHTHSPKMGQGMNTSMQDTYNLGWKLGLVLKGLSPRITLLETYEQERLKVAKALIDFDIRYSSLFSGRPLEEVFQETNIKPEDLPRIWRKNNSFTSGLGIEYESSMLTFAEKSKQELAKNVHVGIRIASTLVTNQADACQIELGKRMLNDGRFRILMFAGDLADADQNARIKGFVQKLAEPNSFANRYSGPTGTPYFNPLIETLTIHASDRKAFELADFPEELHPFDEEYGWAYDRIYAEGERNATKTYDYYAIDRKKGCVVIVRPDHHVGWIGQCEDIEVMDEYFSGIFQRADKMNGK